jgi:hypothetical protein
MIYTGTIGFIFAVRNSIEFRGGASLNRLQYAARAIWLNHFEVYLISNDLL